MRTLTLGVLIVAGGTLAALPFRRYEAIPDASSDPVHVTGPTQSDLTTSQFSQLAEASHQSQRDMTLQTIEAEVLAASTNLAPNLPRWEAPPPQRPKRSIEIPLTYEDLTVPIDMPAPLRERFNAVASARAKQVTNEDRVSGILMPKMESMVASADTGQIEVNRDQSRYSVEPKLLAQTQRRRSENNAGPQSKRFPDRVHAPEAPGREVITEPPKATGSLASSREPASMRRTPRYSEPAQLDPNQVDQKRASSEQSRHWIRQP